MRVLFLIFVSIVLTGCGTTPVQYQSKMVPIEDAPMIIDRMVMTQHSAWKPNYFVITEDYFGWDFGSYSSGKVTSGITYSSFNSTTRNVSDRVYYDEISEVKLLNWTRKFKQWYVVSLYRSDGSPIKHILRTRSLSDAQLLIDALDTFLEQKTQKEHSE